MKRKMLVAVVEFYLGDAPTLSDLMKEGISSYNEYVEMLFDANTLIDAIKNDTYNYNIKSKIINIVEE